MPVVVMEAEDPNVVGTKKIDIVFGDRDEQKAQANRIRANFDEVKGTLKWRTSGSSRDVVVKKISDLADKQGVSERARKVIQGLVDSSFWQEMEANG